jgi:hypothetical protein
MKRLAKFVTWDDSALWGPLKDQIGWIEDCDDFTLVLVEWIDPDIAMYSVFASLSSMRAPAHFSSKMFNHIVEDSYRFPLTSMVALEPRDIVEYRKNEKTS